MTSIIIIMNFQFFFRSKRTLGTRVPLLIIITVAFCVIVMCRYNGITKLLLNFILVK